MAIADAKRFADALASDKKLLAEVKPKVNGLAAFVEAGKRHGYTFSLDDAKQLIRSKVPEHQLSNQQLDAIAGAGVTNVNSNLEAVTQTVATVVATANGGVATETVAVIAAVVV